MFSLHFTQHTIHNIFNNITLQKHKTAAYYATHHAFIQARRSDISILKRFPMLLQQSPPMLYDNIMQVTRRPILLHNFTA